SASSTPAATEAACAPVFVTRRCQAPGCGDGTESARIGSCAASSLAVLLAMTAPAGSTRASEIAGAATTETPNALVAGTSIANSRTAPAGTLSTILCTTCISAPADVAQAGAAGIGSALAD